MAEPRMGEENHQHLVFAGWPSKRFLLALAIVALIVRLVAAVVVDRALHAIGQNGFLAFDDRSYDAISWQQAQWWRGNGPPVLSGDVYLLNVYTYACAALYFVFGHHLIVLKFFNCLFGALTVAFVYRSAQLLFGEAAGRFSGLAMTFFPSTLLWSLLNLKDTIFFCSVACFFWLFSEYLVSGKGRLLGPLLLVLAIIGGIRSYMLAILGVVGPLAMILQAWQQFAPKWRATALLVAGSLFIIVLNGQLIGGLAPTQILMQRYYAAQGAQSAFVPEVPTAEPTATASSSAQPVQSAATSDDLQRRPLRSLIQWMPIGTAYILFAPFPWSADRAVEQVTIPEMLVWYVALACAAVGALVYRERWRIYSPVAGYIGALVLLLAATQGNLGTLVRHRAMLIPCVLIFSGAGASWLWQRWRQRDSVSTVTPLTRRRNKALQMKADEAVGGR